MDGLCQELDDIIKQDSFSGATPQFVKLRDCVKEAGVDVLQAQAPHAPIVWKFLVGFAKVKKLYHNQITQVVYRLRTNEKWRDGFDNNQTLCNSANDLNDDRLLKAFRAQVDFMPPDGITKIDTDGITKTALDKLEEASKARTPRISFIGERGVGKSTLVNSLLGLAPDDPHAAETGADEVLTEEQEKIKKESYHYAGIVFEDVPGCRGSKVSCDMDQAYIKRFELDTTDAAIVMYEKVLSPHLLTFVDLFAKQNVPVFIVRNKVGYGCQRDVKAKKFKDLDDAFDAMKQRTLDQIDLAGRQLGRSFDEYKDDDKLYLIEADYDEAVVKPPTQKYQKEFHRLKEALKTSIRDEAKHAQFTAVMEKSAAHLAKQRAQKCYGLIPYNVMLGAGSGAIPIPGLSEIGTLALAKKVTKECLDIFCIAPGLMGNDEWMDTCLAEIVVHVLLRAGTMVAGFIATDLVADLVSDAFPVFPVAADLVAELAFSPCWRKASELNFPVFPIGVAGSVVVGGILSGIGMCMFMDRLIARLEVLSTRVYEMQLRAGLDPNAAPSERQQALDLVTQLFPEAPEGDPAATPDERDEQPGDAEGGEPSRGVACPQWPNGESHFMVHVDVDDPFVPILALP